ncbi:MAG TPA: transketolase [Caldithrix abyssi]|uniref:Transketolase n=1 Tax=Caldithrix abyssi TaxID=187145 RepID=A0A7V4TXJ1_CALAY|nr:transketolase [Caldithrix abyssi]
MPVTDLDQKSVSVIRALIMDGTRKANSGHPGGAMSSTDFAYVLFKYFLRYSPDNPQWFNRDRFVLSAGHESMLLYSLLTLVGYLDIEDLKNFRQFKSRTPGHPESHLTPGVEATTGPLGQGFSMAVGMAAAEVSLRARLGEDIVSHYTYVLAGDGDLQEPVALGSASLAGHLKLNKLIVFYDRNRIQISGPTSRADSTDMRKVFEGFQWRVVEIDGHNRQTILQALEEARKVTDRPTLIIGDTVMAKGAATREGDHETHGAPLPEEEIAATKEKMGLPADQKFYLPEDVLQHFRSRFADLRKTEEEWQHTLQNKKNNPEFANLWQNIFNEVTGQQLSIPSFDAPVATRAAFGKTLAAFADQLPQLIGGSADLEPSNQTRAFMEKTGEFTADSPTGRNISFGVREFPMGAILNGMALHGGLRPFGATFLVFSDYERPAIRLSAMQKLPVLHVFTHDSFYVGEDGPTHQPVEHLAALRAIPDLLVFRPADANETAAAMQVIMKQTERPSALALTRQKLPLLDVGLASPENVGRGAYIVHGNPQETADMILIASGSEVHLALDIAKKLSHLKIRVISMPCTELFDEQDESYKKLLLPDEVRFRVAIEAGVTFGWERYTGLDGWVFGLNHYGDSAPYQALEKAYGFTPEQLAPVIEEKYNTFKE